MLTEKGNITDSKSRGMHGSVIQVDRPKGHATARLLSL